MPNLPLIPQTLNQYSSVSENMWPGMPVQEDIVRRRTMPATVANTPFIKEIWSGQVTYGADGDQFGFNINGALYVATAQTDDETSAQAWITANGTTLVNAKILASLPTSNGLGLLTLTFVDGLFPTVSSYEPDGTTLTLFQNQIGDGPDLYLTWGMGVIKDPERKSPNIKLIVRRPRTAEEVTKYFKQGGVVKWGPTDTDDSRVARGWPSAVDIAPDEMFEVYMIQSFENPFVHYSISSPPALTPAVAGEDAYLVFDPKSPDWGKFRSNSGGQSQIMGLTFAGTSGGATVAGNLDGLPTLSFPDTGTNAGNAAAFAAAANGNVQYSAIATYEPAGANVVLTFKDNTTHVFTDESSGGPTITSVVIQNAIPAIAALTGLKFLESSVQPRPGISMAALNMSY